MAMSMAISMSISMSMSLSAATMYRTFGFKPWNDYLQRELITFCDNENENEKGTKNELCRRLQNHYEYKYTQTSNTDHDLPPEIDNLFISEVRAPQQIVDVDYKSEGDSGGVEVLDFCKSNGFEWFYEYLQKHKIDSMELVVELTDPQLKELGMKKMGPRIKFMKALKTLKNNKVIEELKQLKQCLQEIKQGLQEMKQCQQEMKQCQQEMSQRITQLEIRKKIKKMSREGYQRKRLHQIHILPAIIEQ